MTSPRKAAKSTALKELQALPVSTAGLQKLPPEIRILADGYYQAHDAKDDPTAENLSKKLREAGYQPPFG